MRQKVDLFDHIFYCCWGESAATFAGKNTFRCVAVSLVVVLVYMRGDGQQQSGIFSYISAEQPCLAKSSPEAAVEDGGRGVGGTLATFHQAVPVTSDKCDTTGPSRAIGTNFPQATCGLILGWILGASAVQPASSPNASFVSHSPPGEEFSSRAEDRRDHFSS